MDMKTLSGKIKKKKMAWSGRTFGLSLMSLYNELFLRNFSSSAHIKHRRIGVLKEEAYFSQRRRCVRA
jgi:hypothetical protein